MLIFKLIGDKFGIKHKLSLKCYYVFNFYDNTSNTARMAIYNHSTTIYFYYPRKDNLFDIRLYIFFI